MIEAVFFDYDGVLTTDKTGTLTTCRYLSERTGVRYDAFRRAFELHANDLRIGRATRSQTWPDVCQLLGRDIPQSLLFEAYESTPTNEEMFQFARSLKDSYRVGIITDNTKDRFDHLKLHQRLPELFDPIVLSADVGCTKGEPAIFEHALAAAEVEPGRALFIDNTQDNVDVAAAMGLKAVYFDDALNDVAALVRLLRDQHGVSMQRLPRNTT